jgi:putative PIN family toxin of toxin-antitoxin system
MILLRLVLDTNIIVSAALKPDGLQRTVLVLALTKPARLYVTDAILAEYREVLARPELNIRKGLRQQLLQLIRNRAHRVAATRRLRVTVDPDDNVFLEMRRRRPRGLLGDGEYASLSEILEENQGNHVPRVHQHRCAAPHRSPYPCT